MAGVRRWCLGEGSLDPGGQSRRTRTGETIRGSETQFHRVPFDSSISPHRDGTGPPLPSSPTSPTGWVRPTEKRIGVIYLLFMGPSPTSTDSRGLGPSPTVGHYRGRREETHENSGGVRGFTRSVGTDTVSCPTVVCSLFHLSGTG